MRAHARLLAALSLLAAACGDDTPSRDAGADGGLDVAPDATGRSVAELAAGAHFTCARLAGGAVFCWGRNNWAQLGDGSAVESRGVPGPVPALPAVARLVAGVAHACARLADGNLWCWGSNEHAQMGNGREGGTEAPAAVDGVAGVADIALGKWHSCVLHDDARVTCWGRNEEAELGLPPPCRHTPVGVPSLAGTAQLAIGDMHSCARATDGRVRCWGENPDGRVGPGSEPVWEPRELAALGGATQIVLGGTHGCATSGAGTVRCWGGNGNGQLGDGSTTNRPNPVDLPAALGSVTAMALGDRHTCALFAGGTVRCWGSNTFGQLGDGSTTNRSAPVEVPGLTGVTGLAAGGSHTCAVTGDGTAYCWGANRYGQLGDGTDDDRLVPTPVVWPAR